MKTEADIWERCKVIRAMPDKGKAPEWKSARRDLVRWIEDELDDGVQNPAATWDEINARCDALVMIGRPVVEPEPVSVFTVTFPEPAPEPTAEVASDAVDVVVTEKTSASYEAHEEPASDPLPKPVPIRVGSRVKIGADAGEVVETKRDKVRVMRDGFQRARWFPKSEVEPA